jgi:hypothetical protein
MAYRCGIAGCIPKAPAFALGREQELAKEGSGEYIKERK